MRCVCSGEADRQPRLKGYRWPNRVWRRVYSLSVVTPSAVCTLVTRILPITKMSEQSGIEAVLMENCRTSVRTRGSSEEKVIDTSKQNLGQHRTRIRSKGKVYRRFRLHPSTGTARKVKHWPNVSLHNDSVRERAVSYNFLGERSRFLVEL